MMTYEMALQRLTALCASAEHCEYEMMEKMRKWEVEESDRERIMEYLRQAKFVDDERYARAFVKDKVRYNKWGRRKVEQGLWAKHIPEDIRQGCSTRLTTVYTNRCSPIFLSLSDAVSRPTMTMR